MFKYRESEFGLNWGLVRLVNNVEDRSTLSPFYYNKQEKGDVSEENKKESN